MRDRLIETVKKYIVIIAIGFAYFIFIVLTGEGIPCIFYKITSLKCPACGVSRMMVSLAHFDILAAFYYNPFLLVSSPLIVFSLVYPDIKYIVKADRSLGKVSILLWLEIILLLVFGVVRNIWSF